MRPITEKTSFEKINKLLADNELVMAKVHVDRDGYNVTLCEYNGTTAALGIGKTFPDALEDAFKDVDEFGKNPLERVWAVG